MTNEYYLTGQLKKSSGSRTYPLEYVYDGQGRIQTMKTYVQWLNLLWLLPLVLWSSFGRPLVAQQANGAPP